MNSMLRNKRAVWICKRDTTVDYEKYNNPVLRRFNFKANSKEAQIESTGELGIDYLIIKDINKYIEDINIGDRVYTHKVELEDYEDTAIDADFVVVSKDLGLDFGTLVLKSLAGNFTWK